MKSTYFKVKSDKVEQINKPESIDKLLDEGYTISEVIEETKNKTKIITYSPKTREEAYKEHRKTCLPW